jgi:hypothetical protein
MTEEGLWLATIRDISPEGIGLTVNRPAKTGMFLTIEIPGQPPVMRKPILVRVTHARQGHTRGWWDVGGQIVRKLTRAELDGFTVQQAHSRQLQERRTVIRLKTRMNAVSPLVRATEEGPWWASVRDVSVQGVSLILDRPLRPGCHVTMALPTKSGTLGRSHLLRIKHVRRQPGSSWWVVGGQFLTRLTRTELGQMR